MIPILPPQAWREFRGAPESKGLNQTTHLASIEDASGKIHRCYVKLAPPNWPTPLTEAIAWLLAESLDLPRPGFAALIVVPLDKLRAHMPLDQHWLSYREALGFCAEAVQGNNPTHGWKWLAWLRMKSLYKRAEVARISAFDQWVENQDRHTGNLLIRSSGECIPIDNEHILYSLLWPSLGLAFGHNSLMNEAQRHMNGPSFDKFKVEMALHAKQHEDAFNRAAQRLADTVRALVPDEIQAQALWNSIGAFLSGRAHPNWMAQHLGVIV